MAFYLKRTNPYRLEELIRTNSDQFARAWLGGPGSVLIALFDELEDDRFIQMG